MSDPTLPDVIRAAIAGRLAAVHVSMPGRVVSYARATQEAAVQPLIKVRRNTEAGEVVETLPVIHRVPVVFFGSGEYGITCPVTPGDTVVLVFSEASLDRWLVSGGMVDPGDARRFTLTDAIAIIGLRDFAHPSAATSDDAMIVNVPTGKELRLGDVNADDAVVVQSALDDFVSALATAKLTDTSGALALLETQLLALNSGAGWKAGTSKVKAS